MEIIDIGLNDLEPIQLDIENGSNSKSVNFGPGIEFLMNDKVKSQSSNINIGLGDLDNLENELNDLSGKNNNSSPGETKTLSGFASNLFGLNESTNVTNSFTNSDSNLGQATTETMGNTKTWDGFTKINEIPLQTNKSSNLTEREKRRKKRMMIKRLEEWYEKGHLKNSSRFNMDSNYEEVEDEYETAMEDKRKKEGVKLQKWWFMTFVNSVEYANVAFNPFDVNLDGWAEQVSEDIDSYEEIFAELHDKYKGGKLAPELALLLRLGFSASVVHFTNRALSSSVPGFNDVIRQSPELMKAFTNATVSSMSQQSPGFAFANNLMQEKPHGPPPPAAVETKYQGPTTQRPGSMVFTESPGNRQDLNTARGGPMFQESGVDINQQYANPNQSDRSIRPPTQSNFATPPLRPEMRGPQGTDIDNILSGLKTRTVNIHQEQSAVEEDSMISVTSIGGLSTGSAPKRSRRKQRSDKNTISLDI